MLPMPAALGSVSLEVLIDYHEKVGLLLDNREKGNRFGSQALYALEESMISRFGCVIYYMGNFFKTFNFMLEYG